MKKRVAQPLARLACILSFGVSILVFSQSSVQVGYAVLSADAGSSLPVATALFTYTNPSGILVSQAGVGATEPISSGLIFVDQDGTETGLGLANPSSQAATATLVLRSATGAEYGRQPLTLEAGWHVARFVSEYFRGMPAGFVGSLTFESTQKLAAITLRQSKNSLGEPLYTTLPVVDLAQPATSDPVVFPQIAFGGGFSTRQVLISTDKVRPAAGKVAFYRSDSTPMSIQFGNQVASQFPYRVAVGGGIQFFPGNTARIASISLMDPQSNSIAREVTVDTMKIPLQVLDEAGTPRDDFVLDYISLDPQIAGVDAVDMSQGRKRDSRP